MILSVSLSPLRGKELVEKIRLGHAEERRRAMDDLIREISPSLHALAFNILGNAADAEDCLQDSLIAITRSLDGFRGDASFSTWAYRITIRGAMKFSKSRFQSEEIDFDSLAPILNDGFSRIRIQEIMTALGSLPAKHRIVLALFALQGLSHQSIADALDIQVGTVWSRLHNARQSLLDVLSDESKT